LRRGNGAVPYIYIGRRREVEGGHDAREAQQFELLLLDQRRLQKLADTTLSDETVVTDANAEQLLEIMREPTTEKAKAEHRATLRKGACHAPGCPASVAEQRDAIAAASEAQVREPDDEITAAAVELSEARAELQRLRDERTQTMKAAVLRVNRITNWIDRAGTLALVI
jgi:hypothetical protein